MLAKVIKSTRIFFLILVKSQLLFGQTGVKYSSEFKFKEGIYLSFSQFSRNAPLPKENIISAGTWQSADVIKDALERDMFSYKDSMGVIREEKSSSVWGYCQNNTLYIRLNDKFNRMVVVGTLCHFTSTIFVRSGYNDPYFPQSGMATEQVVQYVLDTEKARVVGFTVSEMNEILQRDAGLYKEFSALKKRDKKNSLFIFLKKFNDLHPLYFPS